LLISMLGSEQKAISYYIGQTSGKRAIIIVLGLILYAWLFTKRAMIKSLRASGAEINFLGISYLKNYAVLSLIVVLLCLMPFFDAYAPSSYIAVEFLLLLLVISFIFSKRNSSGFMPVWITLVALFIVDALVILLTEPTLVVRLLFLGIQVCIILFTIIFYRKLDRTGNYFKFISTAVITGIILTIAGILCNLTGRISLSGILSFSGIFAVTQSVVLPVFIDTVAEIILLQLQSIRIKKGFTRPFDISVVTRKIKTPMIIIAVMLWILMLSSNLNIYHGITKWAVELFTTPRTIGSISFKLVSVLWFFVIIWMAHILQQLISFLFGETGMETEEMSPISKKQHSRLLITRLLVLVGGYMLAIAASGLPIDKLTFLLGALGVGIGMGLQNVVNNFVSGIILIFDGSLKIGDEIEVSGQAGKVKKIGLRASTLNTADGAEVIIPNGSILSQNIVNWTFSNDQKRVLIWFSLTGKELDSNVITEVINDTIAGIPNVITTKKPVILYNRVTPQSCTITVRFWSGINFADSVKSQAMLALSAAFNERQIGFE